MNLSICIASHTLEQSMYKVKTKYQGLYVLTIKHSEKTLIILKKIYNRETKWKFATHFDLSVQIRDKADRFESPERHLKLNQIHDWQSEKLHQISIKRLFENVGMKQEPVKVSDAWKADLSIMAFYIRYLWRKV